MLDFNVAAAPKKRSKKADAPAPVARDPFDITPIRDELKQYEVEIANWERLANELKIVDETSLKTGIEMASQAKRLGNKLEQFRKEKKEPFRLAGTGIDKAVSVYADPCEKIWKIILNPKINSELSRQKLAKLESERRAQEAAAELQKKLDAESAEKNLPQVTVNVPVLNQKAEPVRTEEGSASQTKRWKARLVDINLVPREYLLVDMPKVNQFVRAGGRVLDGFVIEQEESVNIRL